MVRFLVTVGIGLVLLVTGSVQASYTVTYPNGGESLTVGDTVIIRWTNTDNEFQCHVGLSVDDGLAFFDVYPRTIQRYAATDTAKWGHSAWVIPDSLNGISLVSAQCRIQIRPYLADPTANDMSDGVFEIKPRGWTPPKSEESKKGGCGSGAGLAFLPPVFFWIVGRRKNRD